MFNQLAERFPEVDEGHLLALANVWSAERDQIIERMLEISGSEAGVVLTSDARPEAIFELAKLILWLDDRIITKKLEGRSVEAIDPNEERAATQSAKAQERIENTARICADSIWKRLLDGWHKRFPLILTPAEQRSSAVGTRQAPEVKSQHYSPSFSNELWAVGPQKLIRIYSRSVGEHVSARDEPYTRWGREAFLYSQALERNFQLVETDAKAPYTKLLNLVPLSEAERRCWIAFLLTQMLRTPSFILRILPSLKDHIETQQIDFPTDTASLRRSYETLFSNNELFAHFFRLITERQWEIWSAPSDIPFIRGDDPVVIRGSLEHSTWQLLYPMTPAKCFAAGPQNIVDASAVVPRSRKLENSQASMVNESVAKAARRSVIAQPIDDDSALRASVQHGFTAAPDTTNWHQALFPEYWGRIK